MIRLTPVLLTLGFSMATATTALAQTGAFTALVTPKRHGVGFYAGQIHNNKTFAANGHRDMLQQHTTEACTCTCQHTAVARTGTKSAKERDYSLLRGRQAQRWGTEGFLRAQFVAVPASSSSYGLSACTMASVRAVGVSCGCCSS
jgi:hypothetical protein